MVKKKEAVTLLTEVMNLLDRINKPDFNMLDAEISSLAAKLRNQKADQLVDKINKPILDSLNIKSKEKYSYSIVNEVFPTLDDISTNSTQNSFIEKVETLKYKKQSLKILEYQYLSLLESMQENLKVILDNDKNWLLNIVMESKTKTDLNRSKAFIEKNQSKVSAVRDELNDISNYKVDKNRLNEKFNKNPKEYYDELKERLNYTETPPVNLVHAKIEMEFRQLVKRINDLDIERVDQDILSVYEELKEVQSPHESEKLPIDHITPFLKIDVNLSSLKSHLKMVSNLSNIYIEEISKDYDYTLEEAFRIKEAVIELEKNIAENFQPRINLDNFDNKQEHLIRLVMYRQKVQNILRSTQIEYKSLINELFETFESFNSLYTNEYQITQAEKLVQEEIQSLNNKLQNLYQQLLPLLSEVNNLSGPETYSLVEVRQYFQENSASFYATIERVTGAEDMSSSVPSYIKEAINKQEIDSKGLSNELILRPYQEFGTKFALYYKRTLLGDEMGLGKTIQAIAFINHLFNEGHQRAIVIAPLSVLANWKREINKWSTLDTMLFRSNNRQSAFQQWKKTGGILLTNFEQSSHLLDAGAEEYLDTLIVDEAHFIKNPAARRTKHTNQLAKSAKYAIFMTGTPLENRVGEMRQLVRVLQPDLYDNFEGFDNVSNPEEFKELVSTVYLRRKREEVLKELPELSEVHLWSDFSASEQEYYDEAVMSGISGLMKMRRAGFYGQSKKESEKIAQLIEIIVEAKDNGHKVIVFSFFKIVLNMLKEVLHEYSLDVISGDVSNDRRQEIIDEFTVTEDKNVLLSQIDAGGVGLNIQAANIVVLCEPQWKPSTENQAIGRVYRMGQTRNVIVYRLLTEDSIDERMLELLDYKTSIFNTYAHDSLTAEAFDKIQKGEEISESELSKKVYEIEKMKVENRLKANVV